MTEAALEVGLRWEAVCDDLLARTARFPKTARYSIAARVDNLALDVLEGLTEACSGSARVKLATYPPRGIVMITGSLAPTVAQ